MRNENRRRRTVREMVRAHRSVFFVYFILRILVIVTMIRSLMLGNYENTFLCLLTLILFLFPSMAERRFRIELPDTLQIIILLFIFSAEILGEIQAYYVRIPYWDTILHTLNGFLAAAVGFSLVDLLNNEQKRYQFELSPGFQTIVAFCFSMTIGVLWEFFEFGMDRLFGFDMQKDAVVNTIVSVLLDPTATNERVTISDITSVVVNGQELGIGGYLDIGLLDTMADLFVNFIGAVVFSVIGYLYLRSKGKWRFATRFMPRRATITQEEE